MRGAARGFLAAALVSILAPPLAAQTPVPELTAPLAAPAAAAEQPGPIDEEFDLDIGEKRITEEDFMASLAVEVRAGGERGLDVRAGAVVTARRIELLLRGVTGRVRFFATLAPVIDVIEAHRPAAADPAPGF